MKRLNPSLKKHFQALIFPIANPIFAIHEIVIANPDYRDEAIPKTDCFTALRFVGNDARLRGTKNILRQII